MITAVILAGGQGTRLRSVVPHLPKPMAPIRTRPFLELQMDYWIGQGVDRFVLSVGYKREMIIEHFGERYRGIPVSYVVESRPLGTGGALRLASKGLETTFLLLNGDTYFKVLLDDLFHYHRMKRSEWTFSLFEATNQQRYMEISLKESGEIDLQNCKGEVSSRFANGGVYLVDPSVLHSVSFPEGEPFSLEEDLTRSFLTQGGKIFGRVCKAPFIDIGVPADYCRASDVVV